VQFADVPLWYYLYDFYLRATHARELLPAALASVSFGFVLVRVRVRYVLCAMFNRWTSDIIKQVKFEVGPEGPEISFSFAL
jgi:hypothetical protein